MLLGALLGLVGREKEAAIRDMFETQACMEFIFLLDTISMRAALIYTRNCFAQPVSAERETDTPVGVAPET